VESVLQLKALSKDSSVPASIRTEIDKITTDIEKKGGDATSPFFMPRLISSLLWEKIRNRTDKTFQKLQSPIEKMMRS
jgi:hypothetical protein